MIKYENDRSSIENYIYHQNNQNLSFLPHMHNSYEFICCVDGELEVVIEKTNYTLVKGKCMLISPLMSHSYSTKEYSKTYLCIFSYSYIPDYYEKYKDMLPKNVVFEVNNPLIVIETLQNADNIYTTKSVLYQILSSLIKDNEFYHTNPKDGNLIKNIIDYISLNYAKDISLSSVCKDFGFSYNYISSLFAKYLNLGFCDMVNSYRIYNARLLLRSTSKSIIEISYSCGFDSLRTFNRNFLKYTQQTPSKYRLEKLK